MPAWSSSIDARALIVNYRLCLLTPGHVSRRNCSAAMVTRLFQAAFWSALALAFLMASLPTTPPMGDALNDKQLHVLAFVVLATLAALAFPKLSLTKLFFGLAAFGGLIELVQSIPSLGRNPSLMDWIADLFGAGIALILFRLYRWLRAGSDRHSR